MRQQHLRPRAWSRLRPDRAATIVLILIVGVASAGCAGKTAAQRATDELNAGLAASAQGRSNDAATYYTNCVQLDPTNKFCIFDLGSSPRQTAELRRRRTITAWRSSSTPSSLRRSTTSR